MSPADQRVLQLLANWQTSLELHARYAALPDEHYWLVQPWPRHERPSAWVIKLARRRIADLKRLVEKRIEANDPVLCEALELMGMLANLIGSQHIERFIPLADPAQERTLETLTFDATGVVSPPTVKASPPIPVTAPASTPASVATPPAAVPARTATPRTSAAAPARATTAPTPATPPPAAAESDTGSDSGVRRGRHQGRQKPRAEGRAAETAPEVPVVPQAKQMEVIADAIRLLAWGREWHELPDSIARMAGRPPAPQVRLILRSNRAVIEKQANGGRAN